VRLATITLVCFIALVPACSLEHVTFSNDVLVSLEVSSSNPSIRVYCDQQLKATGKYIDGSLRDLTGVSSWISEDHTVAEVSSSGLATGWSIGATRISAQFGMVTGGLGVMVTDLTSITIGGSNRIPVGGTVRLSASARCTDESSQDVAERLRWNSLDETVVLMNANALGLARGLREGTSRISATADQATATASIDLTVTDAWPRFAYVANTGSHSISSFALDSGTGQLRHSGYLPVGQRPISVSLHPSGKLAYVADQNSNTVAGFTVDANLGTLSPIQGSPFAAGTAPVSVVVDPWGRFVFAANSGSGNVSGYTINASTGVLSPIQGSPFVAGTDPVSATVDPSGNFAFVVNRGSNNVSAYRIDAGSGALLPIEGSPFAAGDSPSAISVEPAGKFAVVANYGSVTGFGTLSVYRIDAGRLLPVSGSPFPAGTNPYSSAVEPSGTFVLVANYGSDSISVYRINSTTGALSEVPGSPFIDEPFPYWVAVEPSGKFAYVAYNFTNETRVYALDGTSGRLTRRSMVRTQNGPQSIAIGRGVGPIYYEPKFAYVANHDSNDVSAYTIEAGTGVLSPLVSSPFRAGSEPSAVVAEPSANFIYVANSGPASNNVSVYHIDAGALTLKDTFATDIGPFSMAVETGGRFAYVPNWGANNVSAYAIDASTGALSTIVGSPFSAENAPSFVAVDPSGKFAYLSNQNSNSISAYAIDGNTGALLSTVPGSPLSTPHPTGVTVEPSGRFEYVANWDSGTVSAYAINANTGALSLIPGPPIAAGMNPYSATVEPSGRFAYVTNAGSNSVSAYTINQMTGVLSPVPDSPFLAGSGPYSITVDASGQFAYVANLLFRRCLGLPHR